MSKPIPANLNDARSRETRSRLVAAAVEALVEVGYSNTTGVEVCNRAGLTRGALNHHFPDFVELLVAALHSVYEALLSLNDPPPQESEGMAALVTVSYQRVIQPQFKAVIELWLASRNDEGLGQRLAQAINEGAVLFSPESVLRGGNKIGESTRGVYRTIMEAMIGIGLGRAINAGPVAHEADVVRTLSELAHQHDERINS